MRFDLDEPLFPPEDARPGIHTGPELDELHAAWGAAKIDEWCAVAGLNSAAAQLRAALGLPGDAPVQYALTEGARKAHSQSRVRRALTAYEQAATVYEGVRVHLADLRNRATIPA